MLYPPEALTTNIHVAKANGVYDRNEVNKIRRSRGWGDVPDFPVASRQE